MPFQKVDAVYLLLDKPNMSDYHWIYFVDQEISINRLVEFKNLSPIDTPPNTTVICAEVTQKIENPIEKVIQDLETVGLIQSSDVLDTKNILERYAYPVYSLEYEKIVNTAQSALQGYDNIYSIGRAAEFRHREADDNFAVASQTVSQISGKYYDQKIKSMEDIPHIKKEKPSKIYAVLLAFNNYEDTHECIQSLTDSEYPDLEIILVDNGSTDKTPEKTRANFPEVKVIENQQNLGVPAGYNVGFKYALEEGAEYIFMLNNDTTVAKDMLAKLYEVAEKEADTGIIMPKILVYGTEDQVWSSGGRYRSFPPAILVTDKRAKQEELAIRPLEYAPSCGLLIHRRAFEKAGLFDPGYFFLFDDWDFSERVRTHGLSIWFVRDAVMWHKVSRTTQGTRSKLYWFTWGASIARFYRRHGRPVWISLPAHAGYIILREFFIFQNWKYWSDFWGGFKEGLRKPLGEIPQYSIQPH
jgi:GT2 family glycosyltransferase